MKKLYIDIRFAKCILALTAGWLMAGCSAEDELENGSATQQLSMTCGALFRSCAYFGAHLRTLIWDASSCRAAQPRGFPLGGSCHRR